MAEAILVSGTTEIMKDLISIIAQESALGGRGINVNLKKLMTILESISANTSDAETCQKDQEGVRLWLKRLKSVAYDAEDVLDEFSYEVIRRSEMDSLLLKVRDFFSSSNHLNFREKMAYRVKDVIKMFEDIAPYSGVITRRITRRKRRQSRHQSFLGDLDKTVGRKTDKEIILNLLFKSSTPLTNYDEHQFEKISVVAIVGTGGLGKTQLAALLRHDEAVKMHFKPIIWVSVSADFDVCEILRDIKEFIDGAKYDCAELNVDARGNDVSEMLKGKTYLLVLDDLWNGDADKWTQLKSYLMDGSEGSKILVTTRKIHVAWNVQGGSPTTYHLQQLSTDECWSIIKERAFSPEGAFENPAMVDLGKEIAKKCCGLPLVATKLGNFMRIKSEECDWASIRDTDFLDTDGPEFYREIRSILKSSYDDLSLALKQCFSYWSLFPKGWEIDREALIQLWMAEGFLQLPLCKEISMEDVGNEYFNILLSHSLFQNAEKFGDVQKYKMNEYVHHLASTVAGDEYSILKAEEVMHISEESEIRRLHLVFDENVPRTFPAAGNYANKLRTVFSTEVGDCNRIERVFDIKNLRVLYISGSSIRKVPASISRLRNLRYLNLSMCHNLDVLHDQRVNSLYNLQTLILHNCSTLSKLPEDIGSMRNLRHLNLSYTRIKVLPNSVTNLRKLLTLDISYCKKFVELPKTIGSLENLRTLDVSHSTVFRLPDSIIDLHSLVKLRLHSCRNLMELPKGFEALRWSIGLDISGTNIKVPESVA